MSIFYLQLWYSAWKRNEFTVTDGGREESRRLYVADALLLFSIGVKELIANPEHMDRPYMSYNRPVDLVERTLGGVCLN